MIDSAAGVSSAAPAPCAARDSDEHERALRQAADERGRGEQAHAGEERAAAVEQVGDAAAEEQQAAGQQHVGADRPLVVARPTGAGPR